MQQFVCTFIHTRAYILIVYFHILPEAFRRLNLDPDRPPESRRNGFEVSTEPEVMDVSIASDEVGGGGSCISTL